MLCDFYKKYLKKGTNLLERLKFLVREREVEENF